MRLTIETVCDVVVHVALQHAILRSRVWRRVEIADGNLRREKADGNSDSFFHLFRVLSRLIRINQWSCYN